MPYCLAPNNNMGFLCGCSFQFFNFSRLQRSISGSLNLFFTDYCIPHYKSSMFEYNETKYKGILFKNTAKCK